MSYSYINPCWSCKKNETCKDYGEIQNAITKIHERTYEEGHKGGGSIVLACCRMQNRESEPQK
jgi:hypothetical protein